MPTLASREEIVKVKVVYRRYRRPTLTLAEGYHFKMDTSKW
jgi:hypothetical protein